MKRFFKLGCLGLIVLFLFLGCVGVFLGGEREEAEEFPSQSDLRNNAIQPQQANADDSEEPETTKEEPEEAAVGDVPMEWSSALSSAENYSNTLHMSKDAIYDQLTSDFDQFPEDAAQYAVDNIEADWNQNALESADSYAYTLSMSQGAIYDQLVSEFDKFTPEQAQYAIDNIDADWNANALESAINYRDMMEMSDAAIYDQLTSQFDQFTPEQAQYAIDNMQ